MSEKKNSVKYGELADLVEAISNKVVKRYDAEEHLLLKSFARDILIELRVMQLK